MIRIVVQEAEAGMAANVGGPVQIKYRTFDVNLPELEAYLREPKEQKLTYTDRQVSGVELLP
jgi:hypothetical protein